MVQHHLSATLLRTFQEKIVEFGALKRVYCAAPACSHFLGPLHEGFGGKTYTCKAPGCTMVTCGKCRGKYDGWLHSCQPDQTTEQVLTLSKRQGWAQCPGCAQMIELNMGCFHMTCRCRTEFCYVCTARWKSCRCPQWDETRLLAAAERRVDIQLGQAPRAAAQRQQPQALPVNQYADQLRRANVQVGQAPRTAAQRQQPQPLPANQHGDQLRARLETLRTLPVAHPRAVPARVEVRAPVAAPVNARPHTAAPGAATRTVRRTSGLQTQTDPWEAYRQELVREAMDDLRENHECAHTRWTYRRGGGRCENCNVHLPHYLFRCRGCQMMSCNRCRRNRL
ncbi:hypothetical protein SERLA73DRAFT_119099 [Serpula lacrymans var. lacrymans S7.3]|uniref:RBR-type E3 ubiquitin transferase n=1 Tax=Serpula lacrymans var. lacrymans (strain S7.3) TaxID=936435 RepID=F8PII2_SERL3|nr:hypothetical protein SERLA73DRAFT_119099 [Serpula lacrymans var. lacrymans S7.3]